MADTHVHPNPTARPNPPSPAPSADSPTLPALRQDLRLLPGEPFPDGAPSWLLFDPVRNSYHRLDRAAYDCIASWQAVPIDRYLKRLNQNLDTPKSEDDLKAMVKFLYTQKLVISPPGGDTESFAAQEFAATPPLTHTLVHKYLFFKIPLVRPDRFLRLSYPAVSWLFSKTVLCIIVLMGVIGLYFAGRQWDVFTQTFMHFLTFEGLIYYGLTLAGLKVCHEFGHAYTAHHFKSRVPVMGLAFLVMFPILYTDTTNAWELTDRRKRVLIDAAGMMTELLIACIAIFLWSFLPDGPLRSAAFFAATTSWVLSLMVNLNPMMRFDGYYLLSDLFGVTNMQKNGFDMGRWHMRETLFGLGNPPPTAMSGQRRRGLITYAYATWVYRFFLFIGIALLVHALFPKAIGIILFVIEIGWFIALPILKELKHWWSLKMDILKRPRAHITLGLAAMFIAVMAVPWQSTVRAPALMRPALQTELYPIQGARIMTLHIREGQQVQQGDVLAVLHSDTIDLDITSARQKLALIEAQLARRVSDQKDRANSALLLQSKAREQGRLDGLKSVKDSLIVRAPHAGIISDMPRDLHAGRFISHTYRIARLVSDTDFEIIAFPKEDQAARLAKSGTESGEESGQAVFISDDLLQPAIQARVHALSPTSLPTLTQAVLSSTYRGPIAVQIDDEGQDIPNSAIFQLTAYLEDGETAVQAREQRGVLKLKAAHQSPLSALMKSISRVLIREADF